MQLVTTMYKFVLVRLLNVAMSAMTKYTWFVSVGSFFENGHYSSIITATTLTILSPATAVNVYQHRTADCFDHSCIAHQLDRLSDWLIDALLKAVLCHIHVLSAQRCTCKISHHKVMLKRTYKPANCMLSHLPKVN